MGSREAESPAVVLAGELVGGIAPYALHWSLYEALEEAEKRAQRPLFRAEVIEVIKAWEAANPDSLADCALWAVRARAIDLGCLPEAQRALFRYPAGRCPQCGAEV